MTILVLIGMVFGIIWEAFHGISWNVVLLLLLMNFVSGFRLDWCIYPSSYQAKPHSSPWFSAACAAAIFYRNHFFCLYQQNKSSKSKVKFRHAINHCKSFPSRPKNLALRTFGELLIVFSTKVNLLYLLYSVTWRCCLLHLIKQNCLLKTFLITLILMTRVSLHQFSLLELIKNCIIFP